jgi:glycosyltransferase involved in cell wall biosynthesis
VTTSQQTLSVVLSVHNAEKTLSRQVNRLLDMLPDLAQRFELLILDDGSTDHTEEVAHELAKDYPQLRVARHEQHLGSNAALQTALENTSGELLVLQDEDGIDSLRSALQECALPSSERRPAPQKHSATTAIPGPLGGTRALRIARRADLASRKSAAPLISRRFFRV